MSYQTYSLIAVILLCLSGLFFLITAFLFIYFKIISVIGDLTGLTARRHIERIREENISSGGKNFRPSPINMNRGKITERMTGGLKSTGRTGRTGGNDPSCEVGAGKPEDTTFRGEDRTASTEVLVQATGLLAAETEHPPNYDSDRGTELLAEAKGAENRARDIGETEILAGNSAELMLEEGPGTSEQTTFLCPNDGWIRLNEPDPAGETDLLNERSEVFQVVKSVILIHTDEVIP